MLLAATSSVGGELGTWFNIKDALCAHVREKEGERERALEAWIFSGHWKIYTISISHT